MRPIAINELCTKTYWQTQTGCSEDQENHELVLKKLRGTRCTITASWGCEKFEYTKDIDGETENGRIEVSYTPHPQTGRMTFIFDIHYFEGYPPQTKQSHENGRPMQFDDLNTAFYVLLPD